MAFLKQFSEVIIRIGHSNWLYVSTIQNILCSDCSSTVKLGCVSFVKLSSGTYMKWLLILSAAFN